MKRYFVIVADAFTKVPLESFSVSAFSKFHAKRKIKKFLKLDSTYNVFAYKEGK